MTFRVEIAAECEVAAFNSSKSKAMVLNQKWLDSELTISVTILQLSCINYISHRTLVQNRMLIPSDWVK